MNDPLCFFLPSFHFPDQPLHLRSVLTGSGDNSCWRDPGKGRIGNCKKMQVGPPRQQLITGLFTKKVTFRSFALFPSTVHRLRAYIIPYMPEFQMNPSYDSNGVTYSYTKSLTVLIYRYPANKVIASANFIACCRDNILAFKAAWLAKSQLFNILLRTYHPSAVIYGE